LPFLLTGLILLAVAWNLGSWLFALPVALLTIWLFFIFRDPTRPIPAAPLGVVSPVDGEVVEVGTVDCGAEHGDVQRVLIRVDSFGPYTARCPAEGTAMTLSCDEPGGQSAISGNGLWLRTDEGADVLLQFHGHRFGLAPRAFAGYGERIGQGQRCAYLRLTRYAEVRVPHDSHVLVDAGQRVRAGADLIARLAQ
jgi:phosphatidylserine decarboxylase